MDNNSWVQNDVYYFCNCLFNVLDRGLNYARMTGVMGYVACAINTQLNIARSGKVWPLNRLTRPVGWP